MTLNLPMFLIVCPLALLAGFVDSVAGGGGLISLPAYYLAGLPPTLAAGTNKLSAAVGTAASTYKYYKGGKIDLSLAVPAALAALPGSYLGTRLLLVIPENVIKIMMLAALPIVAAIVLFHKDGLVGKKRVSNQWLPLVCAFIGFAVGFYDGLVGPGTGTFLILGMTLFAGMEAVEASGSAKVVNLASNIASLATLLVSRQVLLPLGLCAAVFAAIGNTLGAGITMKRGTKFIRLMMIVVILLLLAKMGYDVII